MGWRGTLVLALALAVAVAYAWYDAVSAPPELAQGTFFGEDRPPAPDADIKRLMHFVPSAITAIHVRRGTFDARVARTADGWDGVKGSQALDDFVRNLAELAEIAPLEVRPDERRDYGLDPPTGVVELERPGEPPLVLLIGSHNPSSTGVYVQLGQDGPVAITGAVMLWELDKAIRVLQDTAPAPPEPGHPVAALPATVVGHSGKWESGYGETFFNIVGTVKNTGTQPLLWVRLRADLLDKDEHVVEQRDFYNHQAEGLSREDLPADVKEKLRIVAPRPVSAGAEDLFRTSFLKDETPPFDTYRVSVAQVGQE